MVGCLEGPDFPVAEEDPEPYEARCLAQGLVSGSLCVFPLCPLRRPPAVPRGTTACSHPSSSIQAVSSPFAPTTVTERLLQRLTLPDPSLEPISSPGRQFSVTPIPLSSGSCPAATQRCFFLLDPLLSLATVPFSSKAGRCFLTNWLQSLWKNFKLSSSLLPPVKVLFWQDHP